MPFTQAERPAKYRPYQMSLSSSVIPQVAPHGEIAQVRILPGARREGTQKALRSTVRARNGALPSFLPQHDPRRAKQWQSLSPYTTTDKKSIHDECADRAHPLPRHHAATQRSRSSHAIRSSAHHTRRHLYPREAGGCRCRLRPARRRHAIRAHRSHRSHRSHRTGRSHQPEEPALQMSNRPRPCATSCSKRATSRSSGPMPRASPASEVTIAVAPKLRRSWPI